MDGFWACPALSTSCPPRAPRALEVSVLSTLPDRLDVDPTMEALAAQALTAGGSDCVALPDLQSAVVQRIL